MQNIIKGACGLCLQEKDLLNSHIIPRFTFKNIKRSSGGIMWSLSDKDPVKVTKDKPYKEPLLCRDCDSGILGPMDKYFSDFLYNEIGVKRERNGNFVYLENVSSLKLKGFVIGTLFRMHLTTKPLFDIVDLGAKHSEKIRKKLLEGIEFVDDEFPITITIPMYKGKFYDDMFLEPDMIREFGNRIYRFIVSGVLFAVHVGSKKVSVRSATLLTGSDGERGGW